MQFSYSNSTRNYYADTYYNCSFGKLIGEIIMKIFDFDKELDDLVNALINKCLSPKQRNRLALYITLLREENQKQKEVIDKAIEYIEKEIYYCLSSGDNINIYVDKLLDILKGGSND